MLLETLDSAASRKIQTPIPLRIAQSILETTLNSNSSYTQLLRAYQQSRAMKDGLIDEDALTAEVNRSDGLFSTRWSSLFAADLQGWLATHYMTTHTRHDTINGSIGSFLKGMAFILNHQKAFFQVVLLDDGSPKEAFDSLPPDKKTAFPGSFAFHFGDDVPTRLPQLPPLYTAAVTGRDYKNLKVESISAGNFRLHPIWSGMTYISRVNDPRPFAMRVGNVIDIP